MHKLSAAPVPEGLRFSDAWLNGAYGCGIELGGATACWDTDSLEQVDPAALLDTGRAHPGGLPLPDGGLTRMARGSAACALDADGELRGHCGRGNAGGSGRWGSGGFGPVEQRLLFEDAVTEASFGWGWTCGVLAGGKLALRGWSQRL